MHLSLPRLGIVIVIAAFLYILVVYVVPLFLPFILGWFVAAMIHPMVNVIEKVAKMPRIFAVLAALLFCLAFIFLLVAIVLIFIAKELIQFSQQLPNYTTRFFQFLQDVSPLDSIQKYYEQFYRWYATQVQKSPLEPSMQIDDWLQMIGQQILHLLQQLLTGITQFILAIPNAATLIVFTLLSAIFISRDFLHINSWIIHRIPIRLKQVLYKSYFDLRVALFGFIKTQCILISITIILSIVGLMLLDVEHALAIGFLIGFIDIVPLLGTGVIFLPWILYLFFTQQYSLVIGIAILYCVIIITRQMIEPKLLSKSIGIHPLQALIALFVGLQLLGVWGLLLGPFAVIFLQTLHRSKVFIDLWNYICIQK